MHAIEVAGLTKKYGKVEALRGVDPLKDRTELRRRIGYMPRSPALYEDLPTWAEWLGHALPLYYANNVIQDMTGRADRLQRCPAPPGAPHAFRGRIARKEKVGCPHPEA